MKIRHRRGDRSRLAGGIFSVAGVGGHRVAERRGVGGLVWVVPRFLSYFTALDEQPFPAGSGPGSSASDQCTFTRLMISGINNARTSKFIHFDCKGRRFTDLPAGRMSQRLTSTAVSARLTPPPTTTQTEPSFFDPSTFINKAGNMAARDRNPEIMKRF